MGARYVLGRRGSGGVFRGILASSRSPDGRDDRGACWAGLLGRLATDDVRLHYLLYERWRALLLPHHEPPFQPNLAEAGVRKGLCKMYIPVPELAAALDLDSDPAPPPGRDQDVWFAIVFAMGALKREGLIDAWSANDIVLDLQMYAPEADQPGHIVCPSVHGLHLFFRAHGYPYWNLSKIHSPEVKLETVTHLPTLGDGTRLIADMKRDPAITFREDPFS